MAHTFVDASNRTWSLAINVTSIKRVRELIQDPETNQGLDLLGIVDKKTRLLQRLADDPILLCNVLFALCSDQCKAAGVSDVQFGEGLAGDAIELATQALLKELAGFFPRGRRELIEKALAKMATFQETALARLNAHVESADYDKLVGKRLDAFLAELGNSSTN